jgi:hypothetical protein
MSFLKILMDTAVEDSKVLVTNQEVGDRPEIPRDIEFRFYAKTEERAQLVASFVTDFRYGRPTVEASEYEGGVRWLLIVTIHAPTAVNVVMTLSGFMVCLSQLYDLDYDGWESSIER